MTNSPHCPDLIEQIRQFAHARDWEQFHTPKNLAMAIAGEAGELVAEFQWLSDQQSQQATEATPLRARVEAEMADVAIYLLRLADVLDIDLHQAITSKLALNGERYPTQHAKGNATKYTDLPPATPPA